MPSACPSTSASAAAATRRTSSSVASTPRRAVIDRCRGAGGGYSLNTTTVIIGPVCGEDEDDSYDRHAPRSTMIHPAGGVGAATRPWSMGWPFGLRRSCQKRSKNCSSCPVQVRIYHSINPCQTQANPGPQADTHLRLESIRFDSKELRTNEARRPRALCHLGPLRLRSCRARQT